MKRIFSSIAQLSFQGIGRVLPAIRELSTIHPVYSVSDLSGSHRAPASPLAGEAVRGAD
jgi:hypothetical protein